MGAHCRRNLVGGEPEAFGEFAGRRRRTEPIHAEDEAAVARPALPTERGTCFDRNSWLRAQHRCAGSFILLGVTGLLVLLGRQFIAPYLGREVNATLLEVSKFIHNNVAWAFMIALVMVFVFWVLVSPLDLDHGMG